MCLNLRKLFTPNRKETNAYISPEKGRRRKVVYLSPPFPAMRALTISDVSDDDCTRMEQLDFQMQPAHEKLGEYTGAADSHGTPGETVPHDPTTPRKIRIGSTGLTLLTTPTPPPRDRENSTSQPPKMDDPDKIECIESPTRPPWHVVNEYSCRPAFCTGECKCRTYTAPAW